MATALQSSPMGEPFRFDRLDQPPSPRFTHDEVPGDLDRSFGSSMSISSSFEGTRVPLRAGTQPHNGCFGTNLFNMIPSSSSGSIHAPEASTSKHSVRVSPRQGMSLGAALGTNLNARSPGLGAKLSSPMDMDISPQPKVNLWSPSDTTPGLMRSLADTWQRPQAGSSRPSPLGQSNTNRQYSDRATSPGGASLGNLLGTKLSLGHAAGSELQEHLLSSPDKEPPPKRRPSSLPSQQGNSRPSIFAARPVSLKTNVPQRPHLPLMKIFKEDPVDAENDPRRVPGMAPRHRVSDSSLKSASRAVRKPRSRAASTESLVTDQQEDLERPLRYEPIEELPTPSPSKGDQMALLFHDPQSPAHVAVSNKRPSLASSQRQNGLPSSSSPVSSPLNRMIPPRLASLGPRTFEKTHSTACVPTQGSLAAGAARTSLGKRPNPYSKRPSLIPGERPLKSAYPVLGMSGTTAVTRPTAPAPRRCHSAMDNSSFLSGSAIPTLARLPASPERKGPSLLDHDEMADANGSPIAPKSRNKSRPSLLRRASKDDSSPLGYGTGLKRSGSRSGDNMVDDLGLDDVTQAGCASPFGAEGMPGFGASEKEGKILPCFTVKEDGLMRISPHTLTDLLSGKYNDRITDFNVVDCRFPYEYKGGHVPGAINLSTVENVKNHFLRPGYGQHANGKSLPMRSQSGKPDSLGNARKHVIVFHCEFSRKRAPSMALALRQADRALAQDYPSCHFPEIYVLQGGYCEYFRTYSSICEPQAYIEMDDPKYQDQRSVELNGFRKQFARHRSFTYGESRTASGAPSRGHPGNPSILEEDLCLDDSPCAGGGARLGARLGSGLNDASAADTSFGSVGDSSFEEEVGNSPCAAAGSRRPSSRLLPGPTFPRPGARNGSLGRHVMQRAGTTANILSR